MIPDVLDIDRDSPDGRALIDALAHDHGAAIAHAARTLERLFFLRAPWAPGLRFAGAIAQAGNPGVGSFIRLSNSGTGTSVTDAIASCVGEAVERLSQIERAGDICVTARLREVGERVPIAVRDRIAAIRPGTAGDAEPVSWLSARCARTGAESLIPADWCLRRSGAGHLAIPDGALSTGVAAGPNWEAAALRSVLELVERDAASLWWVGGQRARAPALESAANIRSVELLRELRQSARERRSWLLDVTTDVGVPVIAALSVGPDGRGLAIGIAARLDAASAARAAVLEMCQMEIALGIAQAKHSSQDADMQDAERMLVARAAALVAQTCELLHPAGPARDATIEAGPSDVERHAKIIDHLSGQGIDVYLVDLTRPDFAIPVVTAIAPGLQLMPGAITTNRLRNTIAETGGAHRFTRGFPLY